MRSCATILLLVLTGCDSEAWESTNMRRQHSLRYLEPSPFFTDGASARPLVPGVVSRTRLDDEHPLVPTANPPTMASLQRGRTAFGIYCSVCHGADGYGQGIVVQRGFPAPPSLHEQRLRDVADDHILTVMMIGQGKMPSYAGLTTAEQRLDIVAYIRALQLSQNATPALVPPQERTTLTQSPSAEARP